MDMVKSEFSQNKMIPFFEIDSKIEKIFYERCCETPFYTNMLMEWTNTKEYYCGYTRLIEGMYKNYSRHDQSHSIAILESLYSVLGEESVKRLNITDLWMLLHCAYAHDIGMPYSYDEALNFWNSIQNEDSEFRKFLEECLDSLDQDAQNAAQYLIDYSFKIGTELGGLKGVNKRDRVEVAKEDAYIWPVKASRYCAYLTTEFCRKNHAERAESLLKERADKIHYDTPYIFSARFYKIIAKCCMVHGEDFQSVLDLDKEEWGQESDGHPSFIAAMLRLGDLLDIDNNRFDGILLENYGELPKVSKIHKMKHEAITHMRLKANMIEITAHSDDLEVCKCISEWFHYIEDEVENIIFAWGKIAPKELHGCNITKPKLEVYFCGNHFMNYDNHEFVIDKKLMINLVIGRNLYETKLDFIREYIQNALDGLKMKFWMDVEEGTLDFFINTERDKELKNRLDKITPFDFEEAALKKYGIKIVMEWVDEIGDEEASIQISIEDRGIGIDKECIEAISNIGSGWKKRRRYRKYLKDMPVWLRPTGGFGIGMQSGFMLTDEVGIITKCEGESKGRKIILYSTSVSGKVEERTVDVKHFGTIVTVKIPCEKLLDPSLYKDLPLNPQDEVDFFNKKRIMDRLCEYIKAYVEYTAKDVFFPIAIRQKGFKEDYFEGGFAEPVKYIETIDYDGFVYHIYVGMKYLYMWRQSDAILCKIAMPKNQNEEIEFYYKGIRVSARNRIKGLEYLKKLFPKIVIDIMGLKVKECLTVDRNEFQSDFNVHDLVFEFCKVFFNSKNIISNYYENNLEDIILNGYGIYHKIFSQFYSSSMQLKNAVNLLKKDISEKFVADKPELLMHKIVVRINSSDENTLTYETSYDVVSIYSLFDMLDTQKEQFYVVNMRIDKKDGRDVNSIIKEWIQSSNVIKEGDYYMNKTLFDFLVHLNIDNVSLMQDEKNIPVLLVSPQQKAKKKKNPKKIFNTNVFTCERQLVAWVSDEYPELQVTALPWGVNVEDLGFLEERDGNIERHMIISPIRPMFIGDQMLKEIIDRKDNPLDEMKNVIMGDKSFTYLVNWVYHHQLVHEKYSKAEIRNQYGLLIQYLYENDFKELFPNG